MRTAVAETSLMAYHAMAPRDLSASQARVMAAVHPGQSYSRAEIAQATGMPLQSVCGRVNELIAAKRLEHGPQRQCSITKKTINPVRRPVFGQLPLF